MELVGFSSTRTLSWSWVGMPVVTLLVFGNMAFGYYIGIFLSPLLVNVNGNDIASFNAPSNINISKITLSSKRNGLEFVHITKTAGSSIEEAAARSGIKWGACHWKRIKEFGSTCTEPDMKFSGYIRNRAPFRFKKIFGEPWHTPHHWFRHNPYPNNATFCIVRNPYDRMISEYYSKWGGYKGHDKNNATVMNTFIQLRAHQSHEDFEAGTHFLPQHVYVYDREGNQIIDHIVRFEHLTEDFSSLMQQYHLPIELPPKRNARSSLSQLTVSNLTKDTIQVINQCYEEDFQRFHYRMIQ